MKLYERTAAIEDISRAIAWIALDNPPAVEVNWDSSTRASNEYAAPMPDLWSGVGQ